MEDFHRAGGLLSVLREVEDLLDPTALTVTGKPLVDYLDGAQIWDREVISVRVGAAAARRRHCRARRESRAGRSHHQAGRRVPALLTHRGRAVVFDSVEDLHARIDDPDLEVDADSVLMFRGCGPRGYPGMPEVSNMPLPKKLLEQGVRDMVRICDGRMSGTAYGTVVLHVAPEAAAGGPLAIVQTGDYDRSRRPQPHARPRRRRRRNQPPGAEPRDHRRLRRAGTWLGTALHRPCHPGRHRRRP